MREDVVAKYGMDGVRGLLYGDASHLAMQAVDCRLLIVFALPMAFVWF